jgi:Holliday junction resolvase-like predicted endonuclease
VLVFVEVKTRKNEDFGRPISSVNKAKRHRLSRAAVGYLKRQKPPPDYFRFEVIEVIGEPDMGPTEVVAELLKQIEVARADIGDHDRIGKNARFFDSQPRRADNKKF